MNRKGKYYVISALMLFLAVPSYAQMTDDAVINYVSQAVAAGKSEKQIANELLSKGVPTSQLQRLMKKYQNQSTESATLNLGTVSSTGLESIRPTRKEYVPPVDGKSATDIAGIKKDSKPTVFGRDVFNSDRLSFEPNTNAATPKNYVLGPGDEIIIDIWGVNEATIRRTISPEGSVMVSQIGSLQLSGLTIEQATGKIKAAFAKRYSGIGGENPSSQISVTLGNIRSIQVNIMGDVAVPGTYRLSSFSSVFNALYRAGGVSESGSLRDVQLMREGEKIAGIDIYSFLFEGNQSCDISLKEGDVIMVPPYSALVRIEGGVKRPMIYEMKQGETIQQLIDYAGGFTGDAYVSEARVVRYDGPERRIFTLAAEQFSSFPVSDADEVYVGIFGSAQKLYENRVEVRGSVYRPGFYELGEQIGTVRQLILRAGGLMDDAFLNRAQIIREKPDRSLEVLALPLGAIMDGSADDVILRKNDILSISNVNEISPKGDVTINGYVNNPGNFEYADNMTVEDLILLAGGLNEGASSFNVEVGRRILDSDSVSQPDTTAIVFTFRIADGLMVDGDPKFTLKPYDVVSVRKIPSFVEQKIVTITGEVNYPGQYTVTGSQFRLSDLLARAGGATGNADVHGAMLRRRISTYERNVRTGLQQIVRQTADKEEIDVEKLKVNEIYPVGLQLDKALENPGSDYDVILRDGDEVIVPERTTTVRIQGEVLFPNTVHFVSGKPVRYYVRQAGGFNENARRSKVYVLYLNGTASTGMNARVEPGCEIVVPRRPERDKLTATEIMSISSSAASVAAMVATIVNLVIKK